MLHILFSRQHDGRVRVKVIALHLDHVEDASDAPDEDIVKVDAVGRTALLPKGNLDQHLLPSDWMNAVQVRHLKRENFQVKVMKNYFKATITHVVGEFERQVQSDAIECFGRANPILVLPEQLEAHVLGVDDRLKTHFIFKDSLFGIHFETNVVGHQGDPE